MKIKDIGGVFWKSKDVASLKKWYKDALGISLEDWNGTAITHDAGSYTIFSLFEEGNDYFPQDQAVMLNFQVENIEAWIEHFNKIGVQIVREPEKSEFGTFVWIADPDGRWIEIWEK